MKISTLWDMINNANERPKLDMFSTGGYNERLLHTQKV